MERDTVIAGLLHDTVEDTHLSLEEIEALFGEPVKTIVEVSEQHAVVDAVNGMFGLCTRVVAFMRCCLFQRWPAVVEGLSYCRTVRGT